MIDEESLWGGTKSYEQRKESQKSTSQRFDDLEQNAWNRIATQNQKKSSNVDAVQPPWVDFSKTDLASHTANLLGYPATENDMGNEFENIFNDYMMTQHTVAAITFNFRRNTITYTGSGRNTRPDFTADGITRGGARVPQSSFYEVKQKRGVYLSTDEWQIRGHIDNLVVSQNASIASGFRPNFTLVSVSDVRYSASIRDYAWNNAISYTHLVSQSRMNGAVREFRFVERTQSLLDFLFHW
jgi:hypothetical protein